jgi:tetratricopeptide (TPR) repeat protein
MPRYAASDIPHTASTDHRIVRRAKEEAPHELKSPDGLPLVAFFRGRPGEDEKEAERDRAIALLKAAMMGDEQAFRSLRRILPMLERACGRDLDDVAAWEARAHALGLENRQEESLAMFEAVLGKGARGNVPELETSLEGAAAMAEAVGRGKLARDYWRRAIAVNARMPTYRRQLTVSLFKAEAWAEARVEADAWLRLDPMSTEARVIRLSCLLAEGDLIEARAEFGRIEALDPPNVAQLRIRFERKLR